MGKYVGRHPESVVSIPLCPVGSSADLGLFISPVATR